MGINGFSKTRRPKKKEEEAASGWWLGRGSAIMWMARGEIKQRRVEVRDEKKRKKKGKKVNEK